jgi:signal transduction histidine kinase
VATGLIEQLRKTDLFHGLDDEELMEVGEFCTEHFVGPVKLCVGAGDEIDHVQFVKKGKVAVEVQASQPSPESAIIVDTLVDGEVFAWSALLASTLTVSVRAVEPTEVLDVGGADLLALCKKKPRVGYLIMRNLTSVIDSRLRNSRATLSTSCQELRESQYQLIQAEKLASLGQMAASIAHEINNPLSGVIVYTKLMSKKMADGSMSKESGLELLSKIDSALTRTAWLVRNLLDFARQSPPAMREFDSNEAVKRARDIAAHSAELQHIQVIEELDPSLPRVMGDFDQLIQVCTNLVVNAIHAMPQGGKLTLRTSADGDEVKIQVQDTGQGIPAENMSKLFTPFFTTKEEVKGVGLGLAVSYGIVQRHQGRIEVQSKMGEGTTFTVCLPLRRERSQAASS